MATAKLERMDLFTLVEEGKVIIRDRGFYLQVDLYRRGRTLFAAYGKGFIRLLSRNMTTVPAIRWEAIEGIRTVEEWDGMKPDDASGGAEKTRLAAAE
jgi:hypothetical protein